MILTFLMFLSCKETNDKIIKLSKVQLFLFDELEKDESNCLKIKNSNELHEKSTLFIYFNYESEYRESFNLKSEVFDTGKITKIEVELVNQRNKRFNIDTLLSYKISSDLYHNYFSYEFSSFFNDSAKYIFQESIYNENYCSFYKDFFKNSLKYTKTPVPRNKINRAEKRFKLGLINTFLLESPQNGDCELNESNCCGDLSFFIELYNNDLVYKNLKNLSKGVIFKIKPNMILSKESFKSLNVKFLFSNNRLIKDSIPISVRPPAARIPPKFRML